MVYTRKRKNLRRGGGNNLPKRVRLTPSKVKGPDPIVRIVPIVSIQTRGNEPVIHHTSALEVPPRVEIRKANPLSNSLSTATITRVERPVSSRASIDSSRSGSESPVFPSGSESPVVPVLPPPAAGKGLLATRGNPPKSRKGGRRKTKKNRK
jgi:hypothetical protein